jgi:hypothetical protein
MVKITGVADQHFFERYAGTQGTGSLGGGDCAHGRCVYFGKRRKKICVETMERCITKTTEAKIDLCTTGFYADKYGNRSRA